MEVIHKERIKLTVREHELLESSIALLYDIYDAASDENICNPAYMVAEVITNLLNYCEPTREEIEDDESDELF